MNNLIKISAKIRLARKADLFNSPFELVKPNVVYFLLTKEKDKIVRAGITTHDVYNGPLHQELVEFFIFEHIYVIDDTDLGIPVALPLEPISAPDLKQKYLGVQSLRENFQYYVKENDEEVLGSYTLSSKSNLSRIKYYLDNQKLYKVCTAEEINLISKKVCNTL